jgi:putative ABC transport system permease protein
VTGAGLMIRSFREVVATGVGFDTSRITSTDIDLPAESYADGPSRSRFLRLLIERAQSIPGVAGAAVTDALPLHSVSFHNFFIAGRPEPALDALPIADQSDVSPGYFNAIGLRLETGRWFTDRDPEGAENGRAVVAVNRAFARKFFPNENPLGKILLDGDKKTSSEIVAVVSDYRALGAEEGNRPTIFHVSLQMPRTTLLVRGGGPPQTLAGELRNAIWSLDRDLPAAEVRPMQYYVDQWLSQRRFNTLLLEIFAGLALALGMMGIYGVLSNLVLSRVREIGIRMAIGAGQRDVLQLVIRQAMVLATAGLAAGLVASIGAGQLLRAAFPSGNDQRDPVALLIVMPIVLAVTGLAAYIPARRASRIDPTRALRHD